MKLKTIKCEFSTNSRVNDTPFVTDVVEYGLKTKLTNLDSRLKELSFQMKKVQNLRKSSVYSIEKLKKQQSNLDTELFKSKLVHLENRLASVEKIEIALRIKRENLIEEKRIQVLTLN